MEIIPLKYLPLPARVAFERLDGEMVANRTIGTLDRHLEAYCKTYGIEPDLQTRASVHAAAVTRYRMEGDALSGLVTL